MAGEEKTRMEHEFKETQHYQYEKITYFFGGVRYYRLEPSEDLNNKEMQGALVKRRISKKEWNNIK